MIRRQQITFVNANLITFCQLVSDAHHCFITRLEYLGINLENILPHKTQEIGKKKQNSSEKVKGEAWAPTSQNGDATSLHKLLHKHSSEVDKHFFIKLQHPKKDFGSSWVCRCVKGGSNVLLCMEVCCIQVHSRKSEKRDIFSHLGRRRMGPMT